jgi:hypothetical protein
MDNLFRIKKLISDNAKALRKVAKVIDGQVIWEFVPVVSEPVKVVPQIKSVVAENDGFLRTSIKRNHRADTQIDRNLFQASRDQEGEFKKSIWKVTPVNQIETKAKVSVTIASIPVIGQIFGAICNQIKKLRRATSAHKSPPSEGNGLAENNSNGSKKKFIIWSIAVFAVAMLFSFAIFAISSKSDTASASMPPAIDGLLDSEYLSQGITYTICDTGCQAGREIGKLYVIQSGGSLYAYYLVNFDYVDNTYGTNKSSGWSGSRSFSQITGSDNLQFVFKNARGSTVFKFDLDYFSSSPGAPSGYKSLGLGGDGRLYTGNAAWLQAYATSMDYNFNTLGYVLTANSPVYPSDPSYPGWLYQYGGEVKIDMAAFGASGFGSASITGQHFSPNKYGCSNFIPSDTCE